MTMLSEILDTKCYVSKTRKLKKGNLRQNNYIKRHNNHKKAFKFI